jgi:D-tyrosyl-tRNA(Tyr) deacylase
VRLLVQRVSSASVTIQHKITAQIQSGVVVFLGITHSDTPDESNYLINKLIQLRLFNDQTGQMNHSLLDQKLDILVISQFTLYADCRKGRRPCFTAAAPSAIAHHIYNDFIHQLVQSNTPIVSKRVNLGHIWMYLS